jgi:hypothetical protein
MDCEVAVIDPSGPDWRTSSYSGPTGNCVEVAELPGGDHVVRDTKDHGTGPVLRLTGGAWAAFTAGVRAGEFG